MRKIKDFIKKDWLFIVNFIAWILVYINSNQVGIEALSGLLIFTIISKTAWDYFNKK